MGQVREQEIVEEEEEEEKEEKKNGSALAEKKGVTVALDSQLTFASPKSAIRMFFEVNETIRLSGLMSLCRILLSCR